MPSETSYQAKSDIRVKLTPRASRNQILEKEGEVYRVKVTSAPVDGKANGALVAFLGKRLGISKGRIEITSGKRSRLKSIRIWGLEPVDVDRLLKV